MTKRLGDNVYTRPPGEVKKPKKNDKPWTYILGQYLSATSQNVAAIAMGGGIGWYLDRQFETAPLFLIIGIFIGAVLGFYQLLKTLIELHKKD